MTGCSIASCRQPRVKRGWCNAHYLRWRRNSDPLGGRTPNGEWRTWIAWMVDNGDPGRCWEWPYARDRAGYALIRTAEGRRVTRWLLGQMGADLSEEHDVCHSCDNPPCVNPSHLFVGTRQDNVDDMLRKGRLPTGAQASGAKLTSDDVVGIRASVDPVSLLAVRYEISASQIHRIRGGQQWKRDSDTPKTEEPG